MANDELVTSGFYCFLFSAPFLPFPATIGMVQANAGQKLVNHNIFKSFFVVQLQVVSRYF
jgi:hypothetical protein